MVAVEGGCQQRRPVHGSERGLWRRGLKVADASVTSVQIQRARAAGRPKPAAVGGARRGSVSRVTVDHCGRRGRWVRTFFTGGECVGSFRSEYAEEFVRSANSGSTGVSKRLACQLWFIITTLARSKHIELLDASCIKC